MNDFIKRPGDWGRGANLEEDEVKEGYSEMGRYGWHNRVGTTLSGKQ